MSTRTLELDLTERVLDESVLDRSVLDERALPGSGPAEHGPPRPASRPAVRALVATLVALGVALPIAAGVATLPVHSVRISGDFVRVSKADIERAVAPLLSSRLVRIDVDALRHAALAVPGVREATVRRVWPDSLEILVIEHVAVGRWAGGGYLGSDGTHFTPGGGGVADSLPVLSGPAGSQRRVLDLHVALERVLAPIGLSVAATELTVRGVLHATLRDGPLLVMRPEAVERNVEVYASALARVLAGRLHEIERVDLRYPTGFAVRMKTGDSGAKEQG